jgi:hypothetical protein
MFGLHGTWFVLSQIYIFCSFPFSAFGWEWAC